MTRESYVVDRQRAEWVVRTLINAWRSKLPPFDHSEPVPLMLPKTLEVGSIQHAIWLMIGLLYMRGRIDSAQAFIRLCRVYDEHSWMFDVENFAGKLSEETRAEMHQILKKNGLGFNVRESVQFWDFNLKKLARFWKGNPLLIFDQAKDYDELCRMFMIGKSNAEMGTGFMGLRQKMVSMYLYFLINAKLIKPMMHPGPVDTHNIRVLASTEAVVASSMTAGTKYEFYQVSPVIRKLYLEFCEDVEDVLALSNALWYLSRDFCSVSQGNGSSTGGYRGRATEVFAKHITWTTNRIKRYYSTCGLCPVETVCKWSLPSARQYNQGFLEIRSERPRPHVLQESLFEIPSTPQNRGSKPESLKWSGVDDFVHKDQQSLL
jgi:hypothetical protein